MFADTFTTGALVAVVTSVGAFLALGVQVGVVAFYFGKMDKRVGHIEHSMLGIGEEIKDHLKASQVKSTKLETIDVRLKVVEDQIKRSKS